MAFPQLITLLPPFPWSDERSAKLFAEKSTELKLISLEDVVVEPVRWLWYPYIPLGKLTIIHGDPGEGKTTLPCGSRRPAAGTGPSGGENSEPLTVLYQTAEDGLGDTIKPRLLESKADLQKIYTIDETDFPLSMLDHRIGEAIQTPMPS